MIHRTDDPLHDFALYCEDQENWLNSRPTCDECRLKIQEDRYYEIDGKKYCPNCIELSVKWID